MQPPISIGTVLQNRYRILQILGQGGFGRTYLAADQGRFNEYCALKEFIPPQSGDYALEKSKELFDREASVLYSIQHPQVPQFRAIFEQDHRLFLVQDYVEGKTYSHLLGERLALGQTFTSDEVQRFLQQLLPVLAHIHSKGIIHRDISPDNIMLRHQDGQPVLIDFGVVKAVATQLQSDDISPTTVGKPGYAPSEQIQGGQVFPSSDLYALAVTAIVMLTGRQPGELFDSVNFLWRWRPWIPQVTEPLASVLDRMLSLRPTERYAAASDVLQALQGRDPAGATWAAAVNRPDLNPSNAMPAPPSQMATIAVGRPAQSTYVAGSADPRAGHSSSSRRAIAPDDPEIRSSFWDDPLALGALGVGLVALAGVGAWSIQAWLQGRSIPTPTPSITMTVEPRTPTPAPTPTATATATAQAPTAYSQQLALVPGQAQALQDSLAENATLTYEFQGQEGQTLTTALRGEGVLMTLLGPNQKPLDARSERVLRWEGTLPYSGPYFLQLRPVRGVGSQDFRLQIEVQNPPTPTPTETTPPEPSYETENLTPELGLDQVRKGKVGPTLIQRYRIPLEPGQTLAVNVINGGVSLSFNDANGQPIPDVSDVVDGAIQVTTAGTYSFDVKASEETNFGINIRVQAAQTEETPDPPPPPPDPSPTPTL